MARYRTAEQRRDLVRSWTQSGLSAKQFATSRGLSESSLFRWRLEDAGPPALVTTAPRATVDFVRLVPRAAEPKPSVVVEVGDARIRVEAGFDAALLARVVAALGGAS